LPSPDGFMSTTLESDTFMKRISYCGNSFLTTDGAADALLELVVAFPGGHYSELLRLPALNGDGDGDGDEMVVQVVVGPDSQLLSVPEVSTACEPNTVTTVRYLRGRARSLTLSRELSYSDASAFAEYV
jgi:hypothetical protein